VKTIPTSARTPLTHCLALIPLLLIACACQCTDRLLVGWRRFSGQFCKLVSLDTEPAVFILGSSEMLGTKVIYPYASGAHV
jgi:hypothetical protein